MKYLAIVGCSYSHWSDGNCCHQSYPFLIAEQFLDYEIVDLSIPGSSNNSAYLRIKAWQDFHKIKFDKIIFQITHTVRDFVLLKDNINFKIDNLFTDIQKYKNCSYTSGHYNNNIIQNITLGTFEKNKNLFGNLEKFYNLENKIIKKIYHAKFASALNMWDLEQQIDLLNGIYGKNNVLLFSWHKNFDITHYNINDKIDLPKNFIGSLENYLGTKLFFQLGIDNSPHYSNLGHKKVFNFLQDSLEKFLERK